MIVVKERLWLTADRSRVVPDGHEEAAFLYCIPGQRVTEAEAQKYGLVDGRLPEVKEHFPAETKEIFPQENKRRRGKRQNSHPIAIYDSAGEPCSD